jgi:hypothetical protein
MFSRASKQRPGAFAADARRTRQAHAGSKIVVGTAEIIGLALSQSCKGSDPQPLSLMPIAIKTQLHPRGMAQSR